MLKLLLHLVVAAFMLGFGSGLGLGYLVTSALVVLGAVAVHFVWKRSVYSPFEHLGSMRIATDDPLLVQAEELAKQSWPQFMRIYPHHVEDSVVKFRIQCADGEVENVWGDLLEIGPVSAKVYLRTRPVGEVQLADRHLTIHPDDIIDWQVEFADGTLRGGFTMQATFKIFAREAGFMPAEFLEQLARYRELEEA